jgi:hypothetical protein
MHEYIEEQTAREEDQDQDIIFDKLEMTVQEKEQTKNTQGLQPEKAKDIRRNANVFPM